MEGNEKKKSEEKRGKNARWLLKKIK